jgi:hypothetical protein
MATTAPKSDAPESSVCHGVAMADLSNWRFRHNADPGAQDDLCATCRTKMHAAEALRPKERRIWQLYALPRGDHFEHFFPSTTQVTMHGNGPWLVKLVLDPEGPLWGWYNSHHPSNRGFRGQVTMIYPSETQVRICFTYGPEAETKRGHGEIVRLRLAPVRPAVHPEGLCYDEDA